MTRLFGSNSVWFSGKPSMHTTPNFGCHILKKGMYIVTINGRQSFSVNLGVSS
jgi:hypothetical protein